MDINSLLHNHRFRFSKFYFIMVASAKLHERLHIQKHRKLQTDIQKHQKLHTGNQIEKL